MTQFMLPSHGTGPATVPGETYYGFTLVPVNDTSCWMYCYAWNPERDLHQAELGKFKIGHGIIAEIDSEYMPSEIKQTITASTGACNGARPIPGSRARRSKTS